MKKLRRCILLLLSVLLMFSMQVPVLADEEAPRVVDDAGLFTEDEAAALTDKVDTLSEELEFDIVIVTTNTLDGKDHVAYADDYYDDNGYGYGDDRDGALLLISLDPDDRVAYISTRGFGITAMTDAGIDYMLDKIVDGHLKDEDYYGAADTFADLSEQFVNQAMTGEPYDTGNMPKKPFTAGVLVRFIIVAIIAGLIVGFCVIAWLGADMKSVKAQKNARNYEKGLVLSRSQDLFLYRTVSKVHIDRSSGGGGSSVHTSSSGASHGGGGRSF
ncbi:MAG: TPM domain-containing protein [Lachnospiraceae bacterium]|nr:TPM domain-containing protein [Lachnospiraceae bacterium]